MMRNRFVSAAFLTAFALMPLAACSDTETLPEPAFETDPAPSREEKPSATKEAAPEGSPTEAPEEKASSSTSSQTAETLQLDENEAAFEGTVKHLTYLDMVPPEDHEKFRQFAEPDQSFDVLELDAPTTVAGTSTGGGPETRTIRWIILDRTSARDKSEHPFNWQRYEGRRARIVTFKDAMFYGSDPSTPFQTLIVDSHSRTPEFLD